jgi:hypothetical protein
MRYLLCTLLVLAACDRRDSARGLPATDTIGQGDTAAGDTATAGQASTALPDRLLGTWSARGYDSGSSRAQPFTMTWSRGPDGSMTGTIAFEGGEKYNVKVVSTTDTLIVYQSEPHQSPTLKSQVVTRTQARMVGDTLVGTYTARASRGGKVLRGRFTATRG